MSLEDESGLTCTFTVFCGFWTCSSVASISSASTRPVVNRSGLSDSPVGSRMVAVALWTCLTKRRLPGRSQSGRFLRTLRADWPVPAGAAAAGRSASAWPAGSSPAPPACRTTGAASAPAASPQSCPEGEEAPTRTAWRRRTRTRTAPTSKWKLGKQRCSATEEMLNNPEDLSSGFCSEVQTYFKNEFVW